MSSRLRHYQIVLFVAGEAGEILLLGGVRGWGRERRGGRLSQVTGDEGNLVTDVRLLPKLCGVATVVICHTMQTVPMTEVRATFFDAV